MASHEYIFAHATSLLYVFWHHRVVVLSHVELCIICIYSYYILYALTVYIPISRSVRYQPIFHTLLLYFTLHCARALNDVVLTTIIEMVEILDGRVGKCSVE